MKKVLLLVLLFLALFLAGCSAQTLYMCSDGTPGGSQLPQKGKNLIYVCPDGSEADNLNQCSFVKELIITQRDAETKSVSFITGHVRASGWTGTLINVYPEDGDFYGQIVVSKPGEQSYETLVKIDGAKGIVTCEQNCLYTTQIT